MDPSDIYQDVDDRQGWEDDCVYLSMCHKHHETEKGLLIVQQTAGGSREAWFPKSYSCFISQDEFEYASWLTPNWTYRPRVPSLFPDTDIDEEDVL